MPPRRGTLGTSSASDPPFPGSAGTDVCTVGGLVEHIGVQVRAVRPYNGASFRVDGDTSIDRETKNVVRSNTAAPANTKC